MKIAIINMLHFGSTGKIMLNIAETARATGHRARTFSPRYYQRWGKAVLPTIAHHTYFGSSLENAVHIALTRLTGLHGVFSWGETWQLLRELDRFQPDIVHLHNLHNLTICVPMLFSYLKRKQIPTVWTLHDCWAFTGQCPHFVLANCDKWKTGCHHCPQPKVMRRVLFDQSKTLWRLKKRWFSRFAQMQIVTPSQWLADLAAQSFLKQYPIKVINNGIDLTVFRPAESNFRKKHSLNAEKVILGVAAGWEIRKGLDVFIRLAEELPDEYRIVLVGTNDRIDKELPKKIISIHQTMNQQELAEIYSAADVYVNPTREDNYPTVNMEAIACGTPVITFRTGGSPEIPDDTCGCVVEIDDVEAMKAEIIRICTEKPYSVEQCLERAKSFDRNAKFDAYVKLYSEVLK